MPLAIALSQALTREVSKAGLDGTLPWARPDAKSQVTLMHGEDGQPLYADNIVIAVQHKDMIAEFGTEEAEQAWIVSGRVVGCESTLGECRHVLHSTCFARGKVRRTCIVRRLVGS